MNVTAALAFVAVASFGTPCWPQAADSPQAKALKLGASLIGLGRLAEGRAQLDAAQAAGASLAQVEFHRARAFVREGNKDAAFAALDRAVTGGMQVAANLESEADFAPLRQDPRYKTVLAGVDRNAHPCAHQPESRQFDFWIGEWDVSAPSMTAGPARSRIELVEDRCIIAEYYENGPYAGRSLNVYDAAAKKWRQFWVDNKGGLSQYEGEFKDRKMAFANNNVPNPGGPPAIGKMTFFDLGPNQVRQLIEQSTDEGKTWTVVFDGTYTRRKAAVAGPR